MTDVEDNQKLKIPITFNQWEKDLPFPGISFDYWDIKPDEPYNYYKHLDNLKRSKGRPSIEVLSEMEQQRVGQFFTNHNGGGVELIEYKKWDEIYSMMVAHQCNGDINKFLKKGAWKEFKDETIKSPFDRSIYNRAFIGVGKYNINDHRMYYNYFIRMMGRGYDPDVKAQNNGCYEDVTVNERWYNFQTFCEWCDENYYQINGESMQIDKDILIKWNKVYRPEACMFVTPHINSLFTRGNSRRGLYPIGTHRDTDQPHLFVASISIGGSRRQTLGRRSTPEEAFYLYKEAKEKEIKRVADDYWFNKGGQFIPQFKKVYDAMYAYRVEIDD